MYYTEGIERREARAGERRDGLRVLSHLSNGLIRARRGRWGSLALGVWAPRSSSRPTRLSKEAADKGSSPVSPFGQEPPMRLRAKDAQGRWMTGLTGRAGNRGRARGP